MNRLFPIRSALLVNLVLVMALVLAACNGGAVQPPQEQPSESVAEAEPTEAAAEEPDSEEDADSSMAASSDASASGIVDEIVIVEEPLAEVAVTPFGNR